MPSLSFKPNKPMKICYLKQTQKPTRMSKITKAQYYIGRKRKKYNPQCSLKNQKKSKKKELQLKIL